MPGNLYVILAVPVATGVTTPVVAPTVAFVVLLLLHVPPEVALDSTDVLPIHMVVTPVFAPGKLFTVTTADAAHPLPFM
jgi:hypothetical protein